MKQFVLSFLTLGLLFSLTSLSLSAQQPNYCGTILGEEMEERLREQQRNPLKIRAAEDDVYLPVQFHLVANDEGNGRYKKSRVIRLLCDLNAANAASNTGMQFYMYNDELLEINNTDYYDHDWDNGWNMMVENFVPGAINIFMVLDPADVCGYFWGGPDCVAVAHGCAEPGASTIIHELGHYFSLPHTFSGFESEDNPSSNIENYDRTGSNKNCQFAGDGFCDTYPDYIADRWGCEGTFLEDPTGIEFEVDGSLFMSYSSDDCQERFSEEQIDAMHANLIQYRSDLLADDDVLVTGDLVETSLLYPALEDSEIANTNVLFQWEAVENAEFYNVFIRNFILGIEYDLYISGNSFTIDFLPPNTSFLWEVRPFNDGNYCTPATATQIFKTGDNESFQPMNIVAQQATCFGELNGSISFEAMGGEAPYEYLWEDGTEGPFIDGLAAGVYTVSVTDATGVTEDIMLQVGEPDELTADFSAGLNNALEASIEGGQAPYTYLFDGEIVEELPTDLSGGNHSITVIDDAGCTSVKVELSVMELQAWGIDSPVCHDQTTGNIALGNVLGGVPPFEYLWSTGSTSQNLVAVTGGTYQVAISSSDGLEANYEFVIENPDPLDGITNIFADQVTIEVTGGVPPYSYLWPDGSDATMNSSILPIGEYAMLVIDENGCSIQKTFSITVSSNTGIEDNTLQLELFPNPISAGDAIQIRGFDGSLHQVQLFDQAGRMVFEDSDQYSGTAQLTAGHLAQGIYLLSVTSKSGTWTRKLLVR